jgi:poly(3-hydroxybutyrate) depolymerase
VKRLARLVGLVGLVGLAACGGGHAGAATDAGGDGSAIASRCASDAMSITCPHETVTIGGRTVTYEVPAGAAPAAGWPVVVYYQGSFVPGSQAFAAKMGDAFGAYQLTRTVRALLDRGYAVVAPNALGNGSEFWQTNVPPYAASWPGSDDDLFMNALLPALGDGTLGPLDPARHYAMGISSGGYMTSRMAVSYPGAFRALAIASASYATCGTFCTVPALPADHPPTLFLHGAADSVVPIATMTAYRDQLISDGRVATSIVNPTAGHEWLSEAVAAIPDWFDAH